MSTKLTPAKVTSELQQLLEPYDFQQCDSCSSEMGAWWVSMETTEFIVTASQDRPDDVLGICIGSKVRRKPRAQMRGPWSLGHLRGFLDGNRDHFRFASGRDQLNWLQANIEQLLNTEFLNSDELNAWAVSASRRMFGQD